jgi:transposase
MKLAHLIDERKDERLPLVPVPGKKELDRRATMASYRREVEMRTALINRLHALYWGEGITEIVKKDIATSTKREENIGRLSGLAKEEGEDVMEHLTLCEARIKLLSGRIKAESKTDEDMKLLQSVPGVGPVVSYAFAAYVGDGSRFTSGKAVSNYLGLIPRLDCSGTINREGHISRRGNGYMRALLVQAAWSLVRTKEKGGALKARYMYMTRDGSINKKKSIVVIARKMGEMMYSMLKSRERYEIKAWEKPKEKAARLAAEAISV